MIAGAKYALILVFLLTRTFEHGILLFFVNFQHIYKVQNLEIVRERYQSYEKKLMNLYYTICVLVTVPLISILFMQIIIKTSLDIFAYTILYFIVSWSTLTALYSSTLLSLLWAIWRYHRFEF